MASIQLYEGEFGHVSVLRVASNFVTHAHPDLQLVIHIDGAPGEMVVDGRRICPAPHIAVGVNSLEPHSHSFGEATEPGRFLALYIEPGWIARRHALGPRPFRRTAIPLDPALRRVALNLMNRLGGEEAPRKALSRIESLIDRLVHAAAAPPARSRRATAVDYRVRRAIETMKANLCERICLDDLARSVGLSRPHFFSLFKDQTQLTPNVYWNTLRMEEAVRQLRASEESMTDLACSLGFTSQGNFTRFFRDHTGVPPTLYREATRLGGDFQTH